MRARRGRFAGCASRAAGAVNPRAVGRAAKRTAVADGAAFDRTMRGSGAGRRGGSVSRRSRARWSTAAVYRVSRSTLGGGLGSALRGSAAATGCRSAPACFVRAGFGSAFGGGAAAAGRFRSGSWFGRLSPEAGFVSALRGTVASTGGSGLVWVALTDGAAGGFGASLAAAERSTAGACLVWFLVTEDLDSGLRSSDAKAGRSTAAGLTWLSGGAGLGLCTGGAATTGCSAAGAGFARLSTGAGLGSDSAARPPQPGARPPALASFGSPPAAAPASPAKARRRPGAHSPGLVSPGCPLVATLVSVRAWASLPPRPAARQPVPASPGSPPAPAPASPSAARRQRPGAQSWASGRPGFRLRSAPVRALEVRLRRPAVHRPVRPSPRCLPGSASAALLSATRAKQPPARRWSPPSWHCRKEGVRAPVSPARLLTQGVPRLQVVPPGFRRRPAAMGRDARPLHSRWPILGRGRRLRLRLRRLPGLDRLSGGCSLPTQVFRCGSRRRLRRRGPGPANHTRHVVGGLRRRSRRLGVRGRRRRLGLRPPVTLGGKPLGVERADERKRQKACQEQLADIRTKPFFTHVGHTPAPGPEPAPGYSFENFYRVFTILACAGGVQPGTRREPARRCHPTRPT